MGRFSARLPFTTAARFVGAKVFTLNGQAIAPGVVLQEGTHPRLLRQLYDQRKIEILDPTADEQSGVFSSTPADPQEGEALLGALAPAGEAGEGEQPGGEASASSPATNTQGGALDASHDVAAELGAPGDTASGANEADAEAAKGEGTIPSPDPYEIRKAGAGSKPYSIHRVPGGERVGAQEGYTSEAGAKSALRAILARDAAGAEA